MKRIWRILGWFVLAVAFIGRKSSSRRSWWAAFVAPAVASADPPTILRADNACHIALTATTPESFYTGDVVGVFKGNIETLRAAPS